MPANPARAKWAGVRSGITHQQGEPFLSEKATIMNSYLVTITDGTTTVITTDGNIFGVEVAASFMGDVVSVDIRVA